MTTSSLYYLRSNLVNGWAGQQEGARKRRRGREGAIEIDRQTGTLYLSQLLSCLVGWFCGSGRYPGPGPDPVHMAFCFASLCSSRTSLGGCPTVSRWYPANCALLCSVLYAPEHLFCLFDSFQSHGHGFTYCTCIVLANGWMDGKW